MLFDKGCRLVAGIDEVGRGAVAGPVVVGAVVVSAESTALDGLRESKLLRPKSRAIMAEKVREWAIDFAVGEASAEEIDAQGIVYALGMAGQRALQSLVHNPDAILLDGNLNWLAKYSDLPITTVVKGDVSCVSMAAASVVAKVHRDALMTELGKQHPEYGWAVNKGYCTAAHRVAIREHGATHHHRRTWNL